MHPAEPLNTPPTEGQTIPPEEQILPSGGGTMPPPEAEVQDAATESAGAAAGQAQSPARENPMPIALAGAFVAGVVVGRIFSR
jgi:hypothetical protein